MHAMGQRVEWPTLAMLIATYALWVLGTSLAWALPVLAIVLTGVAIAQFSSLQHEALHDHPFRSRRWNEVLVFPALTLTVPYRRFRATHLAHHHDPHLTDPYDDPESNYFDPAVWSGLPNGLRLILRVNNTLLGRVLLGPLVGHAFWLGNEARLLWMGKRGVRLAWALHLAGLVPVILWLWYAAMPWWGYGLACYLGHALLKIRTFLEHRAHDLARGRTVIIEDKGPLALLFLNNNLHAVHHMHPGLPWYDLPGTYAARPEHYQRRNENYVYRSYGQIFRQHLLRAKDPVAHPIWPVEKGNLEKGNQSETGSG
jgi:fatty acid desaturase